MEEWKEYKLKDFIKIKHGYAFSGKYISFNDNNIVLVTPGNFAIGGGFQEKKCKFFSSDYPDDYVLNPDDLIVTMTDLSKEGDTLGYSAKVPFSSKRVYLHNQRIGLVQILNENIDKEFLYWFMRSPLYQKTVLSTASGSTVKHTSPDRICDIKINLPPLPTQQKIAAILSSLDDKIELNNKINENLEQQAQALFKNWFVDFEPFGGKMPEGWKVGKLSDILCLKKNPIQPGEDTSLPYLPIDLIPIKSLAIREVRPNEEALSSLLRFDENDILIGAMRVYFHRVAIAPFEGITRTTCFVLEPFDPSYFAYGAITCNQDLAIDYAQKTSKGSTMPYAVWEGGLGDFEIPIPDETTAAKFNDIVKPLLEQIKESYFENKTLQELRESLLPKLMNGEIEVNKLEL